MIKVPAERREAVRALSKFVASEVGRDTFRHNGYVSDTPILPAHESETTVSVMSRLNHEQVSRVIVAVYFPGREDELTFVALDAGGELAEEQLPTGGMATIGMLADYLGRARRTVTVSVPQQVTAGVLVSA